MAATVQLREPRWRDIPRMVSLDRAAFTDDPWDAPTFWAELAGRPRRHYVVADGCGTVPELQGYAGLDLGGDVADVMTLAVHPDARGAGLGGRLLEHLHQQARAAGAAGVMLEVRADNAAARALYQTRGYRVVHTRPRYYRGGVDALVMRKELDDE